MRKNKINIIYEDKYIIVVNKPPGLLAIANEQEKENTMFHKVLLYLKQKNKKNKVFVVHRLDKDTSGLMVLAKDERIKHHMQTNWDQIVKARTYIAIVEGHVIKDHDTIKTWLKETKTLLTYSSSIPNDGKLAITKYKKLKANKRYSLLEIDILTGRKNQIRVHMSDIGHPIAGDKKYNAQTNPLKRLGLHANILKLYHPVTKELIQFNAPIPKEFTGMFGDENI